MAARKDRQCRYNHSIHCRNKCIYFVCKDGDVPGTYTYYATANDPVTTCQNIDSVKVTVFACCG